MDCEPLRDVLELTTDLILCMRMAHEITGESHPAVALERLARPGRNCTAVTDGPRGCWFVAGDGPGIPEYQPAFPVRAVNTTGCGDVFHGAYAAERVSGSPVGAAIRFAAATAALKATRKGGLAGIPDRSTVESFLASQRP
jgi:sugar/nucleoside kinase (ribokinase family)